MEVELLDELAQYQFNKMFKYAKNIYPQMTFDDLWQPNDFPLLESDPYFRYEEGVHAGILQAKAALLSVKNL